MNTEQELVLHKKSFHQLTTDELYELLRVRSEVFVAEQNCVYQDLDGDDQKATRHFGATLIDIEAQEYAKGFYESVGFKQSSGTFMLDGIPHIKMTWRK